MRQAGSALTGKITAVRQPHALLADLLAIPETSVAAAWSLAHVPTFDGPKMSVLTRSDLRILVQGWQPWTDSPEALDIAGRLSARALMAEHPRMELCLRRLTSISTYAEWEAIRELCEIGPTDLTDTPGDSRARRQVRRALFWGARRLPLTEQRPIFLTLCTSRDRDVREMAIRQLGTTAPAEHPAALPAPTPTRSRRSAAR
jgi:hypothetical protein